MADTTFVEGVRKFTALKAPMQCPLVLLLTNGQKYSRAQERENCWVMRDGLSSKEKK